MTAPERSFARIETTLKAYARRLPAGIFAPLFRGVQTAAPALTEAAQAGLPDGLCQYLQSMNEKLDSILALLNQQSLQEDFPAATFGVRRFVASPQPGVVQPKQKGMPMRCTVLPCTVNGVMRTVTMAMASTLPRMLSTITGSPFLMPFSAANSWLIST